MALRMCLKRDATTVMASCSKTRSSAGPTHAMRLHASVFLLACDTQSATCLRARSTIAATAIWYGVEGAMEPRAWLPRAWLALNKVIANRRT